MGLMALSDAGEGLRLVMYQSMVYLAVFRTFGL